MRRKQSIFAMVLYCCWLMIANAAQSATISVYVTAPLRDGFVDTDKETQDSIKDLRSKLAGMKLFRIAEGREVSDLVVTVLMRGVGSESFGHRVNYSEQVGRYYANAQIVSVPIVAQTLWVSAVVEIGTYRKEFVGTARNVPGVRWGRWSECAANLAKDLKSWTEANREQIMQHRSRPR